MTAINNLPGLAKFNNATWATDGLLARNDKEKLDSLHKAVTVNVTLLASGWTKNRPYTQTLEIPEMTGDVNGVICMSPNATQEEIDACVNSKITIKEQSIDFLTLEALASKPNIDIPFMIVFGENLAVLTPPTLVDDSNHVVELTVHSTDWVQYMGAYKTTLNIPGYNPSYTGSISMKNGVNEDEAYMAAKARIGILSESDNTIELICRGEKPNNSIHLTIYYGPSIAIVEHPKFGGKITPAAKYTEYNDSKTGIGATNVQTAIENIVLGGTGLNAKVNSFKTISTMKESMDLQVGQIVTTSGYYTENDGGGATYLITANNSEADNGGSVHVLKNNLRAELMLERGQNINLKVFGMYADEYHDDAPAFNRAFDYCKKIKGGTVTWQGKCAISTPLTIDSQYINLIGFGSNSVIESNFEFPSVLTVEFGRDIEGIKQIRVKDFKINALRLSHHGLLVGNNVSADNCLFQNITIENTMDQPLVVDAARRCVFDMISTYNCHGACKVINGASDNIFKSCNFEHAIINTPITVGMDEKYNGYKLNIYDGYPTRNRFINCRCGNSETEKLIDLNQSRNTEFEDISFNFAKTLCTDYIFNIGVESSFTKFKNCEIDGKMKDCGIINNKGHDTIIDDIHAYNIKSNIYILSDNELICNNFILSGDHTPFITYTTNPDKTVLKVNQHVNAIKDNDTLFPDKAHYYNFYMNNVDDLGVVGSLDKYVLDKHLENELIEKVYTANNIDKFGITLDLPFEGVWEIYMFLNIDDGNQGKIFKYNVAYKQNSVYNVANIQPLITPIEWGNNIDFEQPTINEFGNFGINFMDRTETNRSVWTLKLKARRIIKFK